MLERLHISNYALIDSVDIDFQPGLNIITGETGAGKSIMLGALSLLLGVRADSKVIADETKKSVVECTFSLADVDDLENLFKANDIDWDSDQCILRREISSSGRSRAFVNDTPVNLSVLKEISLHLVDIHSQHQNQLLGTPKFQLDVIDAMASNQQLLEKYHGEFESLKKAVKELKATRASLKKTAENAEFLQFQLSKLEEADLMAGEEEELHQNHDRLSQQIETKQSLSQAANILSEGQHSVAEMLDAAESLIASMAGDDTEETDFAERISQLKIEVADLASSLSAVAAEISEDPRDLVYAENRLSIIADLKARFNAASDGELIEKRDALRRQLSMLEDGHTIVKDLESKARKAMTQARATADELTKRRQSTAVAFADQLKELAKPLGMSNLQCEIRISPTDLNSKGADNVEFLFAFNKNQSLQPVADSASGGEISRLMLCIKAIISRSMKLPTILFDEIDTGVSGSVALRMGELMHEMSRRIQTIVITHLPQVAAQGDYHFKVYKEDDDNSTHTFVKPLDNDRRIDELALMLAGSEVDEAARQNARALLYKSIDHNGKD